MVHIQGSHDASADATAKRSKLGTQSASGLIVSSVVGTSIFALPALIAKVGTVSLVVVGVVAFAAMILAILFGQLAQRIPVSNGGLYAYIRYEFGDAAGFIAGWCYWIRTWAGNAAITSVWVLYVNAAFNWTNMSPLRNWGVASIGLLIALFVNLLGLQTMQWVQSVANFIRYIPILFIAIVGWAYVHRSNFGPFRATHLDLYSVIAVVGGVTLFSFIGVEAAGVAARRLRDPQRQVLRASLLGGFLSVIAFVGASAVIMGLVPHHELVHSTSPFTQAFSAMYPHHAWAGRAVAAVAVTAGLGALLTWNLLGAETALAMADDRLFPKIFGWTDNNDTPWFSLVVGAVLGSLLMLWSYETSMGLNVFTSLVSLSVVLVALPYLLSALAQLTYLFAGRGHLTTWRLVRDLLVSLLGGAFSLWMLFAQGYHALYQAGVAIAGGLIILPYMNAYAERRARSGESDQLA